MNGSRPAPGSPATRPSLRVLVGDADDVAGEGAGLGELESDLARLRDAATLLVARRRLDGLLLALTAHPFDAAAYRGLASYLTGPGRRALQVFDRAAPATARGL